MEPFRIMAFARLSQLAAAAGVSAAAPPSRRAPPRQAIAIFPRPEADKPNRSGSCVFTSPSPFVNCSFLREDGAFRLAEGTIRSHAKQMTEKYEFFRELSNALPTPGSENLFSRNLRHHHVTGAHPFLTVVLDSEDQRLGNLTSQSQAKGMCVSHARRLTTSLEHKKNKLPTKLSQAAARSLRASSAAFASQPLLPGGISGLKRSYSLKPTRLSSTGL